MPFITQGKTNVKYLLIVIILAIFAGGLIFAVSKITECPCWWPSSQPQQALPADETANWLTYEHKEYRFEVKYPEDWQVDTSRSKIKNPVSNSYFEILKINNEKGLSLDEWFKKTTIVDGRPTLKAAAKKISINGVEAYRVDSDLEPPNPLFEIVGIASSQREIFTIYAYSRQLDDNAILERMLSTFRFIEGEEGIDKCKYIQNLEEQSRCYFSLALDTKDANYCRMLPLYDRLVSSRNCFSCLAFFNNDPSLCHEDESCPENVFLQNTELCPDIKIDTITMCRNCYLDVLITGSLSLCNLEKSKIDKKERCIINIAIETGDFGLCKKIDQGYSGKSCQDELAVKLNKPEMCDSVSCLDELAVKNKDIKLCDNRIYCILNVADSSDDSSLCEEILDDGPREACYSHFGIEIGKKGSCELCEKIPNAISKRYCMLEVTVISEDYKFCEGINIEDLVKKYTDEEFGFSFYYPYYSKDDEIEFPEDEIEKIQIEKGGYLFSEYMPAGGGIMPWTSYTFYDDIGKCVNYFSDYEENFAARAEVVEKEEENPGKTEMPPVGHYLTEPSFYTVSDLSVFIQEIRWGQCNIVCLPPDKFLKICMEPTGERPIFLDALTKTIIRTDQNIDIEDKKIKKALIEEFFTSRMLSFGMFYFYFEAGI